jgi:hypothetical protein
MGSCFSCCGMYCDWITTPEIEIERQMNDNNENDLTCCVLSLCFDRWSSPSSIWACIACGFWTS